jgi:toxin HigB-1
MIRSFGDKRTEDLFHGNRSKRTRRFDQSMVASAERKLDMLNAAANLMDLRSPPGNRLEALSGDLAGHYSIRVNDQWRFVFRWETGGPADVRLIDYH